MVSVHVITRPSSTHPLFQRSFEVPAGKIHWKTHFDLKKEVGRSGPAASSYITSSKVGRLIGILEGLADMPIEGEITASISGRTSRLTGELTLYHAGFNQAVDGVLYAAGEAAFDLTRDSQAREVSITYKFEITDIREH